MIVSKRTFRITELLLQCGRTLRDVEVGYETYGRLNERGDNAILICHYFSGHSHAAGRFQESDPEPGYWDAVIGPGKAIDTDRFFVISSDSLSNANAKIAHVVTTGPASINPETGRPYGADFPIVTVADFVSVQKSLCESLGLKHLYAVAGPSMGAMQAFEWAARHPDYFDRVIAAIGPGLSAEPYLIETLEVWGSAIRRDPHFNGGEYYGQKEPFDGLVETMRVITYIALHHDWAKRLFSAKSGARWADPDRDPLQSLDNGFAVDHALMDLARARAQVTDANSILRLCRAVQLYNVRDRIDQIRAKFLVITSATDLLIPPAVTLRGVDELRAAGRHVETFSIEAGGGHLDGLNAIGLASDAIGKFLAT